MALVRLFRTHESFRSGLVGLIYHHRFQGDAGLLLNDFKLVAKGETTTQLWVECAFSTQYQDMNESLSLYIWLHNMYVCNCSKLQYYTTNAYIPIYFQYLIAHDETVLLVVFLQQCCSATERLQILDVIPKTDQFQPWLLAAGDRGAGAVGDYDVGNMGPWMKDNARL